MPLSPAELQALSDDLAFARPDTCAVQRLTATRGVGGGQTNTRTTVATYAPPDGCRVDARNRLGTEGIVGGRLTPTMDYVIALPYGATVQEDDIIQVNGTTDFQVIGETGVTSYHAEVEVQCRTIR